MSDVETTLLCVGTDYVCVGTVTAPETLKNSEKLGKNSETTLKQL
jgi:hypothetical protein